MLRPPLSARQNRDRREEFYALHEGVSIGLRPSLVEWTVDHYRHVGTFTDENRLGNLERAINRELLPSGRRSQLDRLRSVLANDDDLLLDAADVALTWASNNAVATLERFFAEARSAYCIGRDADYGYEIQRRAPEEMGELIQNEASEPGRAAEHLRAAWSKCFGRDSDPNDACGEAINAIEVAAKPVIIPSDPTATLGKMCAAIRDKPTKWETDTDNGVETILKMMEMVWGSHLRHGDESAPLDLSQEAAEMTVQTAVLLVSWFRSGRIRLKQ